MTEHTDPATGDDATRWACARGLDAVQEAERVGSWTIGVEHLLSAALLDPIARRLFLRAGGDLATVARWVGRPVHAGASGAGLGLPQLTRMTMTEPARSALDLLLDRVRGDAQLARLCETDGWREPRVRSTLRRRLLHDLLTADGELSQSIVGQAGALRWLIGQLQIPDATPRSTTSDERPD